MSAKDIQKPCSACHGSGLKTVHETVLDEPCEICAGEGTDPDWYFASNGPIWVSICDGEIVGTPFGPDVPDGKYALFEKFHSGEPE